MELINYINSLHNINASGTNTLAESQINSPYFKDIYYPFPIVNTLKNIITTQENTIIILTGHAGDGKSTIAFDLLRELGSEKYSQGYQFKEYEYLEKYNLHVLKDMSEQGLEDRKRWLNNAFSLPGNWLIVSNTGPLLTSIAKSLKATDWGAALKDYEIESEILRLLDEDITYDYGLDNLMLPNIEGKNLYIVNIAKLNNIDIAIKIFEKIIDHPEWQEIIQHYPEHPIVINYLTIKNNYIEVEEGIRLTYLYLLNYEKRMTLRQMLAHLSAAITAGMHLSDSLEESQKNDVFNNSDTRVPLLFSDTFFSYIGSEVWHKAKDTRGMDLVSRMNAGGYTSLEIENLITKKDSFDLTLEPLKSIAKKYIALNDESKLYKGRSVLRRILFMYGISGNGYENAKSLFLGSSNVYKFNTWQLNPSSFKDEARKIKKSCEKALNLFYSGSDDKNNINITLKRSDSAVLQIAQLMICSIPKSYFRIDYDQQKKLPFLYLKDANTIRLDLSLPLLDYIENIVVGDVTESLNPIYKTQLERFKLRLIDYYQEIDNEEITLIRMQSNGDLIKSEIYFDVVDNKKILKTEG